VIGLVSRTGIGTGVPAAIIPLAGNSLLLALVAIMGCSLVLGMGLPSAVSYLLLATIIGPVFADPALGVPILAAHLFIFYFGMMAMVTPPVALAAYATASIAGAPVMAASLAAFRFSLVGFTLPFMFVYRPALCLMDHDGGRPTVAAVVGAVAAAVVGIVALAAGMAGFLRGPLSWPLRAACFAAAACARRLGCRGPRESLGDRPRRGRGVVGERGHGPDRVQAAGHQADHKILDVPGQRVEEQRCHRDGQHHEDRPVLETPPDAMVVVPVVERWPEPLGPVQPGVDPW
jgi:hypothetical protein